VFFVSLNIVFILVGFSFFSVVFVGGVLCVYLYIYYTLSGFVYFGRAGSLRVSLAGRVILSFCVGLRCVECRAGTIYLSASLGWMAGLYRFFFLWLCCSGYGMIETVGGGPSFLAFFSLLSAILAGGCLW
jgi:hypothetical protein